MKSNVRTLLSVLAIGTIAAVSAMAYPPPAAPAIPAPAAAAASNNMKKDTVGTNPGNTAPGFELKDLDGKTVKLSDYKGKTVVIEWFNPGCPVIVRHHKANTFADLYKEFSSKGIVFLAINSSGPGKEGNGVDANKKAKDEWKIEYPILLDEDGKTGKAYGAKTTPHMFIIDKDGKVAYNGAIDDNERNDKKEVKNYVRQALNEILAGKGVTNSQTRAYGCGVKYAK